MTSLIHKAVPLIQKYSINWKDFLNVPPSLIIKDTYTKYRLPSNDKMIDTYLIKWDPNAVSNIHFHTKNGCLFKVVDGEIREHLYTVNDEYRYSQNLNKNKYSYIHNLLGKHKIQNLLDKESYSIHIYQR